MALEDQRVRGDNEPEMERSFTAKHKKLGQSGIGDSHL
jgi:hypothetical protein